MEIPDDLIPAEVKGGQAHVRVLECIRLLGQTFGELEAWDTYCTTIDMLGPDCPYTRVAAKAVLADERLCTQLMVLSKELKAWLMS